MATAEEKAVCNHCNKEVAKANLPMHEAHCQRFLCVCPECDEQFPKEQLEEHRLEEHTLVKCKKCKKRMEKCKLADHEIDECTERLQSCEFCQLNLPLSDLQEHTVACGSRTERCEECNQYVRLKDQVQHAQTCNSEDHGLDSVKQSFGKYLNPLATDALHEDKLGDLLAQDLCDLYGDWNIDTEKSTESENPSLSLSDLQKKCSSKTEWDDMEQISTCPHCHLALPVKTLQWHEKKCRIFESLKQKKLQLQK